ncbi:LysR substrate-binding domain-containing protein [uncultured Enterovirga sp.]|uniref:LysR substrate-binding domain-containing protein n=1 Tax=uncultured Enterovirga sp. TaxID=2026352 RepID=UPI0035CBB95E
MAQTRDAAEEGDAADCEVAGEDVAVRQQRRNRAGGVPRRVKDHAAGHAIGIQREVALDHEVGLARLGPSPGNAREVEQPPAPAGWWPRAAFPSTQPLGVEGKPHVIDGPFRMTANNMEVLLAAAMRGNGVAYGPSFVFDAHLAAGDLVVLLPEHRTRDLAVYAVYAVYPTNRHVPLKLRTFVDYLAASLDRKNVPSQSRREDGSRWNGSLQAPR